MSSLPPIKFDFKNVVIGWRKEAVTFAAQNDYHLIVNGDQRPFHHVYRYDTIESEWHKGIFNLGIKSLLPVPFDLQSISFEGKDLKIITERNTKVLISFEQLHIFDLDVFSGAHIEESIEDYIVYDYFNIKKGSKQDPIILPFSGSFVQEAKFVYTNRVKRPDGIAYKDIITKSLIPGAELENFDYSPAIIKVFLERTFREKDIRAPISNRCLTIEHSYRVANKNRFQFKELSKLDERIHLHGL